MLSCSKVLSFGFLLFQTFDLSVFPLDLLLESWKSRVPFRNAGASLVLLLPQKPAGYKALTVSSFHTPLRSPGETFLLCRNWNWALINNTSSLAALLPTGPSWCGLLRKIEKVVSFLSATPFSQGLHAYTTTYSFNPKIQQFHFDFFLGKKSSTFHAPFFRLFGLSLEISSFFFAVSCERVVREAGVRGLWCE